MRSDLRNHSSAFGHPCPAKYNSRAYSRHAVQSTFNATDTTGGFLLAIGFVLFGFAMFQASTGSGKKIGLATILLSLVAIAGISVVSIVMDNPNDPFFVILLLVLPLILSVNLYKQSR